MGFCLLCNVESVVLRLLQEGDQKPEAGSSAPELWIIIEPLAPGKSGRQDPIQKDTCLHWKKLHPKADSSSARQPMLIFQQNKNTLKKITRHSSKFSHSVVSDSLRAPNLGQSLIPTSLDLLIQLVLFQSLTALDQAIIISPLNNYNSSLARIVTNTQFPKVQYILINSRIIILKQ